MNTIFWKLLCGLMFVVIACRPVRKVQVIKEAISKKDTAFAIVIKSTPPVDTFMLIKDMLQKVGKRKIDFNTFSAKVKLEYVGQETSHNATAYIKMRKDSIILIQLLGPLGIVGLQAKITKDSIFIINKIDKYVQKRSIEYVQDVTQIPFDFYTIQDLIIGNPIFINNNVVSYKPINDQLMVLMVDSLFKNLVTLDTSSYQPIHSKLDDVDLQRNRTCDITYANYQTNNNISFSTNRNISVAEKTKLDVYLDFKQYSFNEPLNFVFVLPKNYKQK